MSKRWSPFNAATNVKINVNDQYIQWTFYSQDKVNNVIGGCSSITLRCQTIYNQSASLNQFALLITKIAVVIKKKIFFCMRLCFLGGQHEPYIPNNHRVYQALLRSQATIQKWKNSFEMIIIIISLTTNFIAAFHGLYLLAAHSRSF